MWTANHGMIRQCLYLIPPIKTQNSGLADIVIVSRITASPQ